MRLATYNIQYGIGLDGRYDLDRITANVRDADIIAFQEVTREFDKNGHADMVAELRERLPGHFSVYCPAMDVDAGSAIDNGRAVNRRLQFGNMVFSRFPILSSRGLLLPRSRTYDVFNPQRCALEALIDAPGGAIRVYSVHLDHISGEERERQVLWLKEKACAYGMEGGAVTGVVEFDYEELPHPESFVLMGDFNMEPESPEYCAMVGRVDGDRRRRAHHPVDALAYTGALKEGAYSWVDMKDNARRQHLDYAFVSADLTPRILSARTDYAAVGSDHLPVWLELRDG